MATEFNRIPTQFGGLLWCAKIDYLFIIIKFFDKQLSSIECTETKFPKLREEKTGSDMNSAKTG